MKKITFMMIAMIAFCIPRVEAQTSIQVTSTSMYPVKITLYAVCTDPNPKSPYHCAQDGASVELYIAPYSSMVYNPGNAPWAPGGDPTTTSPYWGYNEVGIGAMCETTSGPVIGGCYANVTGVGGTMTGSCTPIHPSSSCFYFTSSTCGGSPGAVVNVSLSGVGSGMATLNIY